LLLTAKDGDVKDHTTYSDLDGSGSVELDTSTQYGIKGVSWNVSGNTQHHEIWLSQDDGANWTKMAEYTGEANGCNPLSCPVPPDRIMHIVRIP
jgi:hypothetical protein